jgi:hypothetical protein
MIMIAEENVRDVLVFPLIKLQFVCAADLRLIVGIHVSMVFLEVQLFNFGQLPSWLIAAALEFLLLDPTDVVYVYVLVLE